MKRVCFSNTEEITCPGWLPAEYIPAPLDLPARNQQNKCDTAHVCQAIWEFESVQAYRRGHHEKTQSVPGCGEYGVDNWILWVLGAHDKHVLCKHKTRMGEGDIWVCEVNFFFFTRKYRKRTHAAHQSVYQCRWPRALNTRAGPWGKWSTCSPDSCDLPCHSVLQTHKKHLMDFCNADIKTFTISVSADMKNDNKS